MLFLLSIILTAPFVSISQISPVCSHPSLSMAFSVDSGSLKYPLNTFPPLKSNSPLGLGFPYSSSSELKYFNSGQLMTLNSVLHPGPPTESWRLSLFKVVNAAPVDSDWPYPNRKNQEMFKMYYVAKLNNLLSFIYLLPWIIGTHSTASRNLSTLWLSGAPPVNKTLVFPPNVFLIFARSKLSIMGILTLLPWAFRFESLRLTAYSKNFL